LIASCMDALGAAPQQVERSLQAHTAVSS
jgi:hypothetical protein